MKILTEKKILQIEREFMTKMYRAVEDAMRKGYEKGAPSLGGTIKDMGDIRDEVLDIVLNNFHTEYSGDLVYGWHNVGDFSGFLPVKNRQY